MSDLPLDYESPYTSSGLVRELSDNMKCGVPTHPDWPENLSCGLISMMMGKGRYIENELGKLYANFMSIDIGASGLSYKTVPLKKWMRPILEELTSIYNEEICREYGLTGTENILPEDPFTPQEEINEMKRYPAYTEFKSRLAASKATIAKNRKKEWAEERALLKAIDRNLVDFLKPERFTSEALVTFLQQKPVGIIVGDEYTKTFKGANMKAYLSDNMEDLSRLADCDLGKVATQTRGIEYPEKAYVGFVSATTYYLLSLMKDEFFVQGTGNRILWILDDLKDRKIMSDEEITDEVNKMDFFWGFNDEDAHKKKIIELAQKIYNIRYLPMGLIILDMDASMLLDEYRLRKYRDALTIAQKDLLDKDSNFMARLAQNAMRFAMIHCVGRYAEDFDPSEPLKRMEILLEDATWAIEKMERQFNHYVLMKELSIEVDEEGELTRYEKDQARVLNEIKKAKAKGEKLTPAYLRRQTHWAVKDCTTLLQTMVLNGQIRPVLTKVRNSTDPVRHYVEFDDERQSDEEYRGI